MSPHKDLVVGIDYGVSTTVAAVIGDGRPEVVKDSRGHSIVPSIVAFSPTGRTVVGEEAKERRPIDPNNTLHSMKRIIGETWTSSAVHQFMEQYPFFRLECHDDGLPRFVTRHGRVTAEDLSTKILAHVQSLVLRAGSDGAFAIIGVPTAFHDQQRKATRKAALRAGFEDVICVPEPLAIAWACTQDQRKPDRTIAVYDLGGGTFDLAICEVRGGGIAVLGAGGDEYLGGEDVDCLLADWVVDQVLRRYQWDIRTSPEAMARLLSICEQAKISLSSSWSATIDLYDVEKTDLLANQTVSLEIPMLEALSTDLVRRTFGVCDKVLKEAKVDVDSIDEVYLAGGSTHIPFVPDAVARYFGKLPIVSAWPEHLVATGAALIARTTAA